MPKILRNILALIAGLLVGSAVNMGLVEIGPSLIPPPAGSDLSSMEGIREAMPLMEFKHFIMPFLAHALGTLVGAFIGTLVATKGARWVAYTIGLLFLLGGLSMVIALPSPWWFNFLDLIFAYLPMCLLGFSVADKMK